MSNTKDEIKEFNSSPKLIVITDTGSNSETKDNFKVIYNSKFKLIRGILKIIIHLNMKHLVKTVLRNVRQGNVDWVMLMLERLNMSVR